MFIPARMSLVQIVTLKEVFPDVCQILMRRGIMHVDRARSFVGGTVGMQQVTTDQNLEELLELEGRINRAFELLHVGGERECARQPRVDPFGIAEKVRQEFEPIEKELLESIAGIRAGEEGLHKYKGLAVALRAFEALEIEVEEANRAALVEIRVALVPEGNLTRLRESLSGIPHYLHVAGRFTGNAVVIGLSLLADAKGLSGALAGAHGMLLPLPQGAQLSTSKAVDINEAYGTDARRKISLLRARLEEMRSKEGKFLMDLLADVHANQLVLRSMQQFLQTDRTYLIAGWVESAEVPGLRQELERSHGNRISIGVEPAEAVCSRGFQLARVPTKLRNWILVRPFERLVELYSCPAYNGIDPTFFVALTFVAMFGIMFGDVGQGLTLFVIGLLPVMLPGWLGRLRDFGAILAACGLSSIVCGFLYGSIFGLEPTWLPPLWFRPFENPLAFLIFGGAIGAICISLGLVLNVVQAVRNREWHHALLSEWGLVSALFYWWLIWLLGSALHARRLPVSVPWAIAGAVAPLALMIAGGFILESLKRNAEGRDYASAVSRPFEAIIEYFTNTVSFVRVAAFGLNHAALMLALLVSAKAMSGGVGPIRESIIVEGNILIIALEGLIVFVQCMRLEYYEIFSKFFASEGRKFEPFSLAR